MASQRYHDSDDSDDTRSFKSFDDNEPSPPPSPPTARRTEPPLPAETSNQEKSGAAQSQSKPERFPPEEEACLLAESNSLKGNANQLFGSGSFENAIQTYDRALASCPNYLDYEIAVLRSNVAACHLKLQEWKQAVESATKGIDCLERLETLPSPREAKDKEKVELEDSEAQDIVEEVNDDVEARIERLHESGHTLDEVRKLQIKLLMRRAKGKTEEGGWASLQGADEDYRTVLHPSLAAFLSEMDKRNAVGAAAALMPRLNAAKEREMAEMMDKLKGLGNSILKPFGLSTNNFQFLKDENTGGYSMNFNQNAK